MGSSCGRGDSNYLFKLEDLTMHGRGFVLVDAVGVFYHTEVFVKELCPLLFVLCGQGGLFWAGVLGLRVGIGP